MDKSIWELIAKFFISLFGNAVSDGKIDISTSVTVPIENSPNRLPIDSGSIERSDLINLEPEKASPESIKMNLRRTRATLDGIFGELRKEDGSFVAYTLEHSFDEKPKIAKGIYTCIRGPHRLHNMTEDFITFEIENVPNFQGKSVSGCLFHWGNYNKDSDGCVLLGSTQMPTMIGNSRATWADFMKMLDGVNSFQLTIE